MSEEGTMTAADESADAIRFMVAPSYPRSRTVRRVAAKIV